MTILITGANRGIGLELARHYVAKGERVIATTRDQIPADLETKAEWIVLDVTNPASFARVDAALDGHAIDLLICNAGVLLDRHERLDDGYATKIWADTFAVNVTGPFLTVQNLLPNLQAAKAAKVVIIASKMGSNTHAKGGSYVYRASKAAAINLASNLACDLSHLGISVGAYHPGWVQTDMGGSSADIPATEAVAGLTKAFADLSLATTGCFQNYDGTDLPF
jgi:NAD(P)-dependent dehydrogenase (short-subunit alcohol dehydrogenase family)